MKRYSAFPKTPGLKTPYQMQFGIIIRIQGKKRIRKYYYLDSMEGGTICRLCFDHATVSDKLVKSHSRRPQHGYKRTL